MRCCFYIQLPLVNTPIQPSLSKREKSQFPLNSVGGSASLEESQVEDAHRIAGTGEALENYLVS